MPSFLDSCARVDLQEFNGARLKPDPYGIPVGSALLARNIMYVPGQCGTRFGHTKVWNPGKSFASMANWLFNFVGIPKNTVIFYDPASGVWLQDITNFSAPIIQANSVTGQAHAYFAVAGPRIYIAFFNENGIGTTGGHVYSYSAADDPLFQRPIQAIPTFSQPSSGNVTAGSHNFGYLLQTNNGFTTKPSPVDISNTFQPQPFVTAGGKNVQMQINTTWPYPATVIPIMSTVDNPNQYYIVPDTTFTVPAGSFTALLDIDISDDDLARTGTAADNYFDRVTIDQSSTPPFKPSMVIMYSQRACYITIDGAGIPVCYISDKNDYQAIYLATSGIYLPGQLPIISGFPLRQSLYLLGPHWTYQVSDTGDDPVLWQPPQCIDSAIGTFWVNGTSPDVQQGYCWVADQAGLFLFEGGAYDPIPVSYYQEKDWKRINWAVQGYVQDSAGEKKVRVYAALDGSSAINYVLTWDYTNGRTAEAVQYSVDDYSFPIGAPALVQSPIDRRIEEWVGPSHSGYIVRTCNDSDPFPYRDSDEAGYQRPIIATYRTAILPGPNNPQASFINFGHAAQMKVRGNGQLVMRGYDQDQTLFAVGRVNGNQPITLSTRPSSEYISRLSLASNHAALEFETNQVDHWFLMSWLKYFFTAGPGQM